MNAPAKGESAWLQLTEDEQAGLAGLVAWVKAMAGPRTDFTFRILEGGVYCVTVSSLAIVGRGAHTSMEMAALTATSLFARQIQSLSEGRR